MSEALSRDYLEDTLFEIKIDFEKKHAFIIGRKQLCTHKLKENQKQISYLENEINSNTIIAQTLNDEIKSKDIEFQNQRTNLSLDEAYLIYLRRFLLPLRPDINLNIDSFLITIVKEIKIYNDINKLKENLLKIIEKVENELKIEFTDIILGYTPDEVNIKINSHIKLYNNIFKIFSNIILNPESYNKLLATIDDMFYNNQALFTYYHNKNLSEELTEKLTTHKAQINIFKQEYTSLTHELNGLQDKIKENEHQRAIETKNLYIKYIFSKVNNIVTKPVINENLYNPIYNNSNIILKILKNHSNNYLKNLPQIKINQKYLDQISEDINKFFNVEIKDKINESYLQTMLYSSVISLISIGLVAGGHFIILPHYLLIILPAITLNLSEHVGKSLTIEESTLITNAAINIITKIFNETLGVELFGNELEDIKNTPIADLKNEEAILKSSIQNESTKDYFNNKTS